MDSEQINVNASDREYRKKRVEELGSALAQIRARVKANRGSSSKKDEDSQESGGSKPPEGDSERTAMTKKILEEDRARFTKLQQNRVKMKEAMDQILIEREEQKKVEKQLQEAIAKVTAPTPELPPLIKQRIIDLETTVENLKERLTEKDKVLSSKTQALTLLHNQLMQRSQEQVDKAMAFTQEISSIKEDFGKREELLKKEINRLKEREEELECRLSDKEMSSVEFQTLQSELNEVRNELTNAISKNEESSKQLESVNKINLKLKAQLKALKIERDKMRQSLEGVEDIETLKNRIALLEEEKESVEISKSKVNCLEEELRKIREDFKQLDEAKTMLQENLDGANKQIQEQEILLQDLRTSLKAMEEQKISAEMRSIELEEKMENLQTESTSQIEQLTNKVFELRNQVEHQISNIETLSEQLSLKEQEISDIKGNNFSSGVDSASRMFAFESNQKQLVERLEELELRAQDHDHLTELVSEKNEIINNLKIKNDELQMVITDLNNNKATLENEIQRLKANEEHSKKDNQDSSGNPEVKEDSDLTRKFKKLAANYKIKVKLCQELEGKVNTLEGILEEKSKLISDLMVDKESLKLELDNLKGRENSLYSEISELKTKNEQLLRLVEEITPKLEAMEVERSAALMRADKMNKAFEELKEWKEGDTKLLKEHVSSVNSMASNVSLLEQELGKLQSIVSEKNSVIGELETERKKLVEDMRNSELELERLRNLYQQESVKNQNVLTNLEGLESEMLVSREEMNQIAEQLEAVTKNYNSCLGSLQERENYIEALEQDIVGMKSKLYNLEAGISDKHRILEERGNQLSARLEEAEIITQTFDKYQADMDRKFKMMEDNENAMKINLKKLREEIEGLNKINSELKSKNETAEKKISDMIEEITTLNDIKNNYNATLDRIEILNEELKQVMCDFEAKNQEIERLGEERADIFNKLTDLEDAYSDLRGQLEESEEQCSKLQAELDQKGFNLENSLKEVESLKEVISAFKNASHPVSSKENIQQNQDSSIQMFSWDQHNPSEMSYRPVKPEENESLLEEKTKMLEDAMKQIDMLQINLSSTVEQKEAEISLLKEELQLIKSTNSDLQKTLESQKNTNSSDNMLMFSWDTVSTNAGNLSSLHNELEEYKIKLEISNKEIQQLKASLDSKVQAFSRDYQIPFDAAVDTQNIQQEELNETKTKLESAQKEINQLRKSLSDMIAQNDHEMSLLKEELERIAAEKAELENSLSLNKFQPDDLRSELIQKTDSLHAAQKEISSLQSALSSVLSEKDNEITLLKEETSRLLRQIEVLDKALTESKNENLEMKQGDVKMFSWGPQNIEAGKDEEDGWGWIGAEAHLDHKHSEALQIQKLTQRVKELEEEQVSLNEKLNASKIKCVKLIKKLKEMEVVQEQSKTERNVGFSDLDFALQEELRSQLDTLEIKNKELNAELSTIKLERDNLNKKVDVLVSANDQLIEMKERQDIEVQMWQKRSAELKNEVQGLQWSLEELKSETPSLNKGGDELSEKLNALALENEELQRIICNLKDGRPLGSPDIAAELNSLKDELKRLKEVRVKEKESFANELKKANEELDVMEQQFDSLSKESLSLKEQVAGANQLKQDFTSLNEQMQVLNAENVQLKQELLTYKKDCNSDLQQKIELLSNENNSLKNDILRLTSSNEELNKQLAFAESMKHEVSSLFQKIEELGFENSDLKEKLAQSHTSNLNLTNEKDYIEQLKQQIGYLNAELSMFKQEYQNITGMNQRLQQDIALLKQSSAAELQRCFEKAENDVKNVENNFRSVQSEMKEFETFLENITSIMQLTLDSNNRKDKFTKVLDGIQSLINSNTLFESKIKEYITSPEENIAPTTSFQLGSTPPVFKGFSSFTNDPFDNLQVNQDISAAEGLKTELQELKMVVEKYENDFAKLNAEKMSYETTIRELNEEIASMNENVAKLNMMHNNQVEEMRIRLEKADSEIGKWRDEVNKLRTEIANLVEKHSQEIEGLKRNEEGSKQKVSEIEENLQNTLLNKDQENRNLSHILSDKEQLLANAINERNALQTQYETMSQQFFSLENRLRDLSRENEELQTELNKARRDENTVIEKQKEEIQELMGKLEYMSQTQNLRNAESENEEILKQQVKELSDKLCNVESINGDLQSKIAMQTDEINILRERITDLDNKRLYLEQLIVEKQREIEHINEQNNSHNALNTKEKNADQLIALIKEKDLEIARVSKVLLDTQERLVQIQDSKSIDKILSLQNKLDQALHTIHDRDVQIDELTREIIQLLGERDALQLRLSETLREIELLRQGTEQSSSTSSPELKSKLGELHQGYKKDPAVQLDMESRHTQQMDLYSDKEQSVDYGIFNWFFSSPTSPSQQQ